MERVEDFREDYSISHLQSVRSIPFDLGQPKTVVVLTYQRCGSSFFGQLFNTNPDVFYLYEPLDALYSALYGTREGWNVPSDITSYWDGAERLVPEKEKNAVSVFLKHMLSCRVNSLPTESLIHRYWFMFSGDHIALDSYIKCLRQNSLSYSNCSQFTPHYCGNRFGEYAQDRMDDCNQMLWNETYLAGSNDKVVKDFRGYKKCMSGLRDEAEDKCVPMFRNVCAKSRLRSAKTVRATMASMDNLLSSDPNFRVIHLVRDPRAVVLSRREFDNSGRGKYSMGDMVKEAKLYCRTVVRDVRDRRKLDKLYPGRIMRVIYEDLVQEPLVYSEKIYEFLNTTLPEKTIKWIIDHTTKVKDSSSIAQKWQDKLSFRKTREIMGQCEEFFREIPYEWPM